MTPGEGGQGRPTGRQSREAAVLLFQRTQLLERTPGSRTRSVLETTSREEKEKEGNRRISVTQVMLTCQQPHLPGEPAPPPLSSVHLLGGRPSPRSLVAGSPMRRPLPHPKKVAECNYAESATGAISIRQTSVVSFSLSKAFLLPNCSYRIIA